MTEALLVIGALIFLVFLEMNHRKNRSNKAPDERHPAAGVANYSAQSNGSTAPLSGRSAGPNPSPAPPSRVPSSHVEPASPRERYEQAMQLWNSEDGKKMKEAAPIFLELCKEGVDFPGPYRKAASLAMEVDEVANSGTIVSLLKKAYALAPHDQEIREELQIRQFTHGKISWDNEKSDEAFNSYMEGLELFTSSGEQFGQSSPLTARIAFRASRYFVIEASKEGNTDRGVRFLNWCEKAGIDMNKDIEIPDAVAS